MLSANGTMAIAAYLKANFFHLEMRDYRATQAHNRLANKQQLKLGWPGNKK
jgi:hypothetical protein